jgi:hypothetical protein
MRTITVAVLCAAVCTTTAAQRQRKISPGPRAVGVLVWAYSPGAISQPPPATRGQRQPAPWLVPVVVWENNRFWDAAVYRATPRPFALEPEVIYEGMRAGESVGLFTVSEPTRVQRSWFADGRWRTNQEIEASSKRRGEAAKPPAEITSSDERPRLRRGGSTSASTAPPSNTTGVPSAPADTGKTSSPSSPSSASSEPATSTNSSDSKPADEDPSRPVLRRHDSNEKNDTANKDTNKTSQPQSGTAPTSANRTPDIVPMPPGEGAKTSTTAATVAATSQRPAPARAAAKSAAASSQPLTPGASNAGSVLVAVSDAHTTEPKPFTFTWNAEEQKRGMAALQRLANQAIERYIAQRYRAANGAAIPGIAPNALSFLRQATAQRGRAPAPVRPPPQLSNVDLKSFDVDTDNYPELVFSATRTEHGSNREGAAVDRTFYVTLVARGDLDPNAREPYRVLLSHVTDDARLESEPRLIFLDVIDADGDGIAELLFRTAGPPDMDQDLSTWGFELFRAGPDRLQKLFDSVNPVD